MPKRKHTQEAIKQRGEVFTPTPLVNEMLDKLPPEVFTDKTKTFLDNSCGNGQFLFEVMRRKMTCLTQGSMSFYNAHKQALSTIYGIELDSANAEECRTRLLGPSKSMELRAIVDYNIITADALDQNHPGWKGIGFYWDETQQPDVEAYYKKLKEAEEKAKVALTEEASAVTEKETELEVTGSSQIYYAPVYYPPAKSVEDFKQQMQQEVSKEEAW